MHHSQWLDVCCQCVKIPHRQIFAVHLLKENLRSALPSRLPEADRLFAPARIAVAKGSVVHFANDEKFVHHAFVDTAKFAADTGDIPPGETRDIVFTQSGIFTIRCAIHPQMKLVVEVSEQE